MNTRELTKKEKEILERIDHEKIEAGTFLVRVPGAVFVIITALALANHEFNITPIFMGVVACIFLFLLPSKIRNHNKRILHELYDSGKMRITESVITEVKEHEYILENGFIANIKNTFGENLKAGEPVFLVDRIDYLNEKWLHTSPYRKIVLQDSMK